MSSLLDSLKKRVAVWQIKQELASLEYAQNFSQHAPDEAHKLMTLKLQNDLAKFTVGRNKAVAPKQHPSCKNSTCYPERMPKVFN